MARQRHLRNAPIVEAIIDIRVQLPDSTTASSFEPLRSKLADKFPNVVSVETTQGQFTFEGGALKPTTTRAQVGLVFRDIEQRTVAQFRVNGFTFNRLAPYSSWEAIFPETLQLWAEYVEAVRPVTVVRLAARYLNRLRFPLPVADLGTYLSAPPRVPEGVPQLLRSFLTRLVISHPERNLSAIVTQALEPSPADPDHLIVLLDIDAYREVEFAPDDPRIESVLVMLRGFKNDIFFNSITEDAARLFE